MSNRVQLTKDFYKAFAAADRGFVEHILADDFAFSSPPDPHLDREGYFARCWPWAGKGQEFDFVRLVDSGDEVIVTYRSKQPDGAIGWNTEVLTFTGDTVRKVEVYFGWAEPGPKAE